MERASVEKLDSLSAQKQTVGGVASPREKRKVATQPAELRPSGIPIMDDLNWGTHICAFFESKQDVLDMLVGYFRAGLQSGEFCVWAISEPITKRDALRALRKGISKFDEHLKAGSIEIVPARDWYLDAGAFDLQRVNGNWGKSLNRALAKGCAGMRISGNAFWINTNRWREFREYEHDLEHSFAGQKLLALCTYPLLGSRAVDLLDVARAHKFTLALRQGKWEFLSTPELIRAKTEIRRLTAALDIMSKPFPGSERLTAAERAALAHIVRGASAKETARALGVSPRTVEFHRANILQKLRVKNITELMFRALSE